MYKRTVLTYSKNGFLQAPDSDEEEQKKKSKRSQNNNKEKKITEFMRKRPKTRSPNLISKISDLYSIPTSRCLW